jgi:hypothetical protein
VVARPLPIAGRAGDVVDLELTWRAATGATVVLAAGVAVLRYTQRPRVTATALFAQETALILGLFALWQYAGTFSVMSPDGAIGRGQWIWHQERVYHLPSEVWVQRLFLPHPMIVEFFNLYYAVLHFPVLIGCMIWLFVRHRERYRRLRTTVVAFTGCCLLIQLIPVAPPRMLPGTQLIDTAVRYGQSVYSATGGFDADQLSAMPSVHVGWAILVAIVVIGTVRSRWRWLALLYPVLTTVVVVATANHYWLDGIVAGLVLAAVLAIQNGGRRMLAWLAETARENDMQTGLLPAARICDHRDISSPAGTGGTSGLDDSRSIHDRAPAGRDRPS